MSGDWCNWSIFVAFNLFNLNSFYYGIYCFYKLINCVVFWNILSDNLIGFDEFGNLVYGMFIDIVVFLVDINIIFVGIDNGFV